MKESTKQPHECKCLLDVRNEIDRIDQDIVKRLGERFQYVKEAVKYKTADVDSIKAKDRYNCVIDQRGQWAKENGLNSQVIQQVYQLLLNYFIEEELKIANHKK